MGLWLPCTIPEATLYFFEHNQTQESNWTLAIHIFLSFLEAVGAGAAACRPPRRGPAAAEPRGGVTSTLEGEDLELFLSYRRGGGQWHQAV